MATVTNYRYKLRRATAAEWDDANPTLALAEPGLVVDGDGAFVSMRIGDGSTPWLDLPTAVASATDLAAALAALAAHLADTVDAHDASAVSFAPAGSIAATDVQAAVAEVATEAATATALKLDIAGHTSNSLPAASGGTSLADLSVPLSTLLGRKASGNLAALSVAEVLALLAVYTSAQTDSAISTAIANLVATSPATLDTLNELAAALGNDPNFATTMTNALAGKVAKTLWDANTVLKADTDDTPVAMSVPASTVVGRKASGSIAALTGAEVAALIPSGTYVAAGGATVYRTGYASPGAGVNAVANITGSLAAVASDTEHLLQTSWLDNNVVAIQNTRTGNTFSAARFLNTAGAERGAIGFGNDTPGTYPFHGAMFVESSQFIAADGTTNTNAAVLPLRFITTGKIGSTFFQYRRQEFDAVGDVVFWDLATTMAGQKENVRIKTTTTGATARVGIGYGVGASGDYGSANPAATLDVYGQCALGSSSAGGTGFPNRQTDSVFPVTIWSAPTDGRGLRIIRDTVVKVDLTIQNNGTGSIKRLEFIDTDNSSVVPLKLFLNGSRRVIQGAPNSAPVDANLDASTLTAWVDESGNNLTFRVKYANGSTVKSGTVALT